MSTHLIKNLSCDQLAQAVGEYVLKHSHPGYRGAVRVHDSYLFKVVGGDWKLVGARVEVLVPDPNL